MIIAVTYENGQVFQHFGHSEQFKLYKIEDHVITDSRVVSTGESGHEALPPFLKSLGVEVLICGGIGAGAKNALCQAGIIFYGGVEGNADAAVNAYLNSNLQYDSNAQCSHHDGDDHGNCGEHQCGSH